jgi:prevent-host-death family protein
MEVIPISKFKARCLSIVDRVRRTGRPIRLTRYGRPMADVVPASAAAERGRALGTLADRTVVRGDIIGPAAEPGEWEALR